MKQHSSRHGCSKRKQITIVKTWETMCLRKMSVLIFSSSQTPGCETSNVVAFLLVCGSLTWKKNEKRFIHQIKFKLFKLFIDTPKRLSKLFLLKSFVIHAMFLSQIDELKLDDEDSLCSFILQLVHAKKRIAIKTNRNEK